MTTKKFADYIYKQTKSIHNIMIESMFNDYIVYRNGKRIGVITDNKLYMLSTDNLKKILPNVVEENPFGWAYYKLIHIENTENAEMLKQVFMTVYNDLYFQKIFVCDISFHFTINRLYPDHIMRAYELHVIFLRFCYEKGLLKVNPLDKQNRILYMYYTNNDLTEKGQLYFNDLIRDWLTYTDRTDKIDNIKMLEKYYIKMQKEKDPIGASLASPSS